MSSCDGVRPIVVEPVQIIPKGSPTPHTKALANPLVTGHQPENWHRVSMFWDFGSIFGRQGHRDGSFFLCIVTGGGRFEFALLPEALRRLFLRAVAAAVFYVLVAAATSASCRGTSQQNIAFQTVLQLQTLRRLLSRPVAAGVSFSLKDVAASQYVCSRGADNPSSISLRSLPRE